MYGSEVWGPQNSNLADKLQVWFLKLTLGLHMRTPTVMMRGETGCYPISIDITVRVLCYWFKIVQCKFFKYDRNWIPVKYKTVNVVTFGNLMKDENCLYNVIKLIKKVILTFKNIKKVNTDI